MAPEPDGATDERATVILLRRTDNDTVMAAIWHYACHATAVVPPNAVSADFPGAVRRALRRQLGDVPCVFVQGFCGDISPKIMRAPSPLSSRLRSLMRLPITGPTFPSSTPDDYIRWSEGLAAAVVRIAQSRMDRPPATGSLATGLADVALSSLFQGRTPDKPLTVQTLRLGAIELMALSAEVTMEWQPILESKVPPRDGTLRLYAGYLGTLYGYLPTPDQIRQGGYEVTGFQHLFGLSGRFDADKIVPAVVDCVKRAVDDLERALQG